MVEDLPRNTMGKVQKNLLREQHKTLFTDEHAGPPKCECSRSAGQAKAEGCTDERRGARRRLGPMPALRRRFSLRHATMPQACACTGLSLDAALQRRLRERFTGCLCQRCLTALAAGAPLDVRPPERRQG